MPTAPLQAVRKALGLTQDQIAERVHGLGHHRRLTRQDICQYETGARVPSPKLQVLLATAYGLDHTQVTWGASSIADQGDAEALEDPEAPLAKSA